MRQHDRVKVTDWQLGCAVLGVSDGLRSRISTSTVTLTYPSTRTNPKTITARLVALSRCPLSSSFRPSLPLCPCHQRRSNLTQTATVDNLFSRLFLHSHTFPKTLCRAHAAAVRTRRFPPSSVAPSSNDKDGGRTCQAAHEHGMSSSLLPCSFSSSLSSRSGRRGPRRDASCRRSPRRRSEQQVAALTIVTRVLVLVLIPPRCPHSRHSCEPRPPLSLRFSQTATAHAPDCTPTPPRNHFSSAV